MQTTDVLDVMGGLIAQLKVYAAKLPPIVHLSAVPTGVKPKFEAIEEYEEIVSRFRSQSAGTPYRGLNELFVNRWRPSKSADCSALSIRSSRYSIIWNECSGIKRSKSDGSTRSAQASIGPH